MPPSDPAGAPPFSRLWLTSIPSSNSVVVPVGGAPGLHRPGAPATPFPVVAAGRVERAVIGHVIEGADGARRAAGHQRHQSGERIRRLRGRSIQVVDAGCGKFGQIWAMGRTPVDAADPRRAVDEIERVHAVDADQQHMLDLIAAIATRLRRKA